MTLEEIKQLSNRKLLYLYDDLVNAVNGPFLPSNKMQKLLDDDITADEIAEIIIERMGGDIITRYNNVQEMLNDGGVDPEFAEKFRKHNNKLLVRLRKFCSIKWAVLLSFIIGEKK